jgi:hypothetical protein
LVGDPRALRGFSRNPPHSRTLRELPTFWRGESWFDASHLAHRGAQVGLVDDVEAIEHGSRLVP